MNDRQSQQPRRQPPEPSPWQQAGLALSIPSLLAAGPLAGWLIGWLIQRWTGWGNWVVVVFVFVGLAAGIRESIRVIQKLS